jgi:hypothetical protein
MGRKKINSEIANCLALAIYLSKEKEKFDAGKPHASIREMQEKCFELIGEWVPLPDEKGRKGNSIAHQGIELQATTQ